MYNKRGYSLFDILTFIVMFQNLKLKVKSMYNHTNNYPFRSMNQLLWFSIVTVVESTADVGY